MALGQIIYAKSIEKFAQRRYNKPKTLEDKEMATLQLATEELELLLTINAIMEFDMKIREIYRKVVLEK